MTNIFKSPLKGERKKRLVAIGEEALRRQGYSVSKVRGSGKSSVRRVTKGTESRLVTIRTTQDQWISFPRLPSTGQWRTLCEVELVMAVSVDDIKNPKFGLVHIFEQPDIVARFDRAYAARIAADRTDPGEHGVWVSLYDEEAEDPVALVGAGAGLASPPIDRIPMDETAGASTISNVTERAPQVPQAQQPLTIAQAKQGLALTFGVDPSSIKITVEG